MPRLLVGLLLTLSSTTAFPAPTCQLPPMDNPVPYAVLPEHCVAIFRIGPGQFTFLAQEANGLFSEQTLSFVYAGPGSDRTEAEQLINAMRGMDERQRAGPLEPPGYVVRYGLWADALEAFLEPATLGNR